MPEPSKLVWRSDLGWSATSPAASADPKKGLVIHYDSANQGLAEKPHSACIDYWNSTRDFHVNERGWDDIGYSFFACPHGYVIEGRGLFKQQAAQPGGNSTYYSCTLSGGEDDTITDDQINAVRELRVWLMEPNSSIAGTVKGHRDFKSTSCPGETAYAMVQNGTFEKKPGSDIGGNGGDELIGLEKGDNGERVKALQALITYADVELPEHGVDGDYGDETAEGLRKAREKVGSRAKDGYGDEVTGYAYAQLMRAVARAE